MGGGRYRHGHTNYELCRLRVYILGQGSISKSYAAAKVMCMNYYTALGELFSYANSPVSRFENIVRVENVRRANTLLNEYR